jgi:hypothetical protein
LEQIDKYGAVVQAADNETAGMHERLMKKINDAARRRGLENFDANGEVAQGDPRPDWRRRAASADAPEGKNPEPPKPGWTDL